MQPFENATNCSALKYIKCWCWTSGDFCDIYTFSLSHKPDCSDAMNSTSVDNWQFDWYQKSVQNIACNINLEKSREMKDQIPCIKQEGQSSQKTTPTSVHHFFPDSSANLTEIDKLFYSRNTIVPLITFNCITNKTLATAFLDVCFCMHVYTARYMCIQKHTHTSII